MKAHFDEVNFFKTHDIATAPQYSIKHNCINIWISGGNDKTTIALNSSKSSLFAQLRKVV